MGSSYVAIKTPYPPEGISDPLELDSDPAFKASHYKKLAESLLPGVAWSNDEGRVEIGEVAIGVQAADACLFLNVFAGELTAEQVQSLSIQALELGAVVMDAETTEIISAGMDL